MLGYLYSTLVSLSPLVILNPTSSRVSKFLSRAWRDEKFIHSLLSIITFRSQGTRAA